MIGGVDRGRGLIWSRPGCQEGKWRWGDFRKVSGKRCEVPRLRGGAEEEEYFSLRVYKGAHEVFG